MMRQSAWMVIAAGAVLAAVIVTRTTAQVESAPGACCWPNGACFIESISVCAAVGGVFGGDSTDCASFACPTPPPTVTGIAVVPHIDVNGDPTSTTKVFRAWSDGATDVTFVSSNACGPPGVCGGPNQVIPGTCPTDVNRDGDTGIADFLTLLGGWGACR